MEEDDDVYDDVAHGVYDVRGERRANEGIDAKWCEVCVFVGFVGCVVVVDETVEFSVGWARATGAGAGGGGEG